MVIIIIRENYKIRMIVQINDFIYTINENYTELLIIQN